MSEDKNHITEQADISYDELVSTLEASISDDLMVSDEVPTKVEEQPEDPEVETAEESEDDYLADVDADDSDDADTPEDDSEAEEEEESDEGEDQIFQVTIDGEDIDVPLEELKKGYSRHSDYTKKTQELAEERKALEAEAKTLEYLRVQREHQPKMFELESMQKEIETAERALHYGRTEDGYELTEEDVEITQKNVDKAKRKLAFEAEELNKKISETAPPMLDELREEVPELFSDDQSVRKPVLDNFAAELKKVGFSQVEIDAVNDPRILLLVKQASEGRALAERVAKAKARKEKGPGPVSKSTKSSRGEKTRKSTRKPEKSSSFEKYADEISSGDMTNLGEFLEDLI